MDDQYTCTQCRESFSAEEMSADAEYVRYTVIDADTGERFSTKDFSSLYAAASERNRLALRYGKQWCLRVGGIDADGRLHEIDDT